VSAPDDILSVTARYRAALARREAVAAARMERAYTLVIARIEADATALAARYEGEDTPAAAIARSARYRTLQGQAEAELAQWARYATGVIAEEQRAALTIAKASADDLLRLTVGTAFDRLPTGALQELVGALGDGSPLKDLLAGLADDGAKTLGNELLTGLARGLGPASIARNLRAVSGTPLVRAMAISRTSVMQAFRAASLESYRQNSDVVSGYRWLATKSSRTCLNCLSRDGSVWPLSRIMPVHVNCRCALTPITRSGLTESMETGRDWFARQDEATQRTMMGPRAYDAYQRGDVRLSDFEGERSDPRWGQSTYQRSLREILGARELDRAAD